MIRQLNDSIQQLGIANGLLYLLGRFLQKISNGRWRLIRYYIVAQPIPSPPSPSCKPSSASSIERIASDDTICAVFPRPKHVIEKRFSNGNTCLVARVKGQFAGFLWYANNCYEEDEIHCRFVLEEPEHSVWDYDVHVEPPFRMGRTFARLWDKANDLLGHAHIHWSFSRISAFNPASLHAHRQLGTKRIGTLTAICLGTAQMTFLPTSPYIHFCWGWSGRPVVVLYTPGRNGQDVIASA